MNFKAILAGSAIASLALFSNIGAPVGMPQVSTAEAAVSVSFNVFYDRLANDGDWVRYQDDYVFIPAKVKRGWKPYTVGHWVYADRVGWTWASDESFGWATYHYGRWGYSDEIGWYWVPGTRWAPAWVSWKRTNDYVVWAPLPPRRDRSSDVSVTVSVGDVPDFYWVAVPTKRFLEPNLRVVIVDNDVERRRIVERAEVIGTVKVENNIVVNNVINVDVIERESGRKVKRVAIRDTNDPAEARASADQVTVFQGEVKAESDAKPKRVRDVKEARKIKREDAGSDNADTGTTQEPADATGTTTRQNKAGAKDNSTTEAPADSTNTSTGTDVQQNGKKRQQNKQAQPSDTQDGTSATTDGTDESTTTTTKQKPEKRQKNKAAGQPDQPTSKNKGNGADVTLPADNENGNGADVTVPDQAQSGKAKADQNRQKAQQKKQKAVPEDQGQTGDQTGDQTGQQKQKAKQNAAPDESGQTTGKKARQNQQQPDEQGGAQKPQRKNKKQQNCDPSDPSCAQ